MTKPYRRTHTKIKFNSNAFSSLLSSLWEFRSFLYLPFFMILLNEVVQMGSRVFISQIYAQIQIGNWGILNWMVIGLLFYYLVLILIDNRTEEVLFKNIRYGIANAYEQKILTHVVRLGHTFNSSFPISVTQDRINKIDKVTDLIEDGFVNLISNLIQGVISMIVLLTYSWQLTVVALVGFALFAVCNQMMIKSQTKARKRRKDRQENHSEVRMRLISANTTLVTNSALDNAEDTTYKQMNDVGRISRLELKYILRGYGMLRSVVLFSGRIGILLIAVNLARLNQIDIPRLVLIVTVSETMFIGFSRAVRFISNFMYTSPSILMLDELMRFDQTIEEPLNPSPLTKGPLGFSFRNVNFVYRPIKEGKVAKKDNFADENLAKANQLRTQLGIEPFVVNPEPPMHLCNINMCIEPGQTVAFVGQSGAGKSTLSLLLLKLQLPDSGELLVNGVNINDVDGYALRERIALVPQGANVDIFNDSLLFNITLGNTNYSIDQVIDALKVAELWETVLTWPSLFYETIGERGRTLSGGQQQRVAIARAAIRNPDLIILDEATSALDTETERLVQASLNALLKGRTAVMIAHRLSTVRHVDKIVVLHNGAIVEVGTWEELLAQNGYFTRLVNEQTL